MNLANSRSMIVLNSNVLIVKAGSELILKAKCVRTVFQSTPLYSVQDMFAVLEAFSARFLGDWYG